MSGPLPFPSPTLMVRAGASCTWDPTKIGGYTGASLDSTDLIFTVPRDFNAHNVIGSLGRRLGKFYFEASFSGNFADAGVAISQQASPVNQSSMFGTSGYGMVLDNGGSLADTDSSVGITHYLSGFHSGDTVMVAVDLTNNLAWFGVNGSWASSTDPGSATGGQPIVHTTYYPGVRGDASAGGTITGRFKASALQYTPPTGFSPWG